jgi:hypothetical protein
MRKITLALAMAVAFAGSAVVTADAQTTRGANNIAGAVENFTPIQPAACRGWGALLPAGIRAHVRPVSLLVSPLLVTVIARTRPAARPRPLFDRATATI